MSRKHPVRKNLVTVTPHSVPGSGVVVKKTHQSPRKIPCRRCQGTAVPKYDAVLKKEIYSCINCNSRFTSTVASS